MDQERRDQAADALAPRIAQDMMWLVPPDQRHVDGMALAQAVGKLLLDAFLAALMKDVAKRAMDWVVARLGSWFAAAPAETPPDIAAAAAAAPAALADLAQRQRAAAEAEAQLVAALRSTMPEAEARRVAAAVREEALRHVFADAAAD
jgi:hypothetical protein